MSQPRLLFASIHSYLDPSGGAALSTCELLELLAACGWACRALACGVLDYQLEPPLDELLADLDLAEQVLERFRPDLLLTYGGHPVSLELMRRAQAGGIPVVFHLQNFGYDDRRGFAGASAILFP